MCRWGYGPKKGIAVAVRVVIIGASGYSGAELVSLLLGHGGAGIVGLYGSGKSEKAGGEVPRLSQSFGRFRGVLDMPVRATDIEEIAALRPDAAFLCTPHEASLELAPALRARGVTVFDLSAAYRLQDTGAFEKFYGLSHKDVTLLRGAVYGLPEVFRDAIKAAGLVAVPGCYPTSAILALAPLVKAGAVKAGTCPIIDATSGISGAGRKAEQRLLFCEVSQQAYGVFRHRHQPEIDAYVGLPTVFTPHTGAYERGILSTIHVELASGWHEARVREAWARAYEREPFVRLCAQGVWPGVADVRGTNFCDLACAADEHGHLIICSAIDNLVKGAAGQAVQCMNIRFGFAEAQGLLAGGAR
jgi:N-acetyl-gamma-glutamyl-phosphate reductase